MNLLNQLSSLPATLSSLGTSRLLALAGTGVLAVALIAVAAMFLNRPSYETLYVGLGFLEAFRTLCVSPSTDMKVLIADAEALELASA